ncbi:MAG: hypothetical protein AB7P46_17140, partial [Thermoanaerobaculia bacterium]
ESDEASREAWLGRVLAAGVVLAVLALLFLVSIEPFAMLLPFPWNRGDRAAFSRQQLSSKALAVDRAARTYFLIEGRYPESLGELTDRRLLARRSLEDALGSRLVYRNETLAYSLEVGLPEGESRPPAVSETISGDFVIDPDFYRGIAEDEANPLILLN